MLARKSGSETLTSKDAQQTLSTSLKPALGKDGSDSPFAVGDEVVSSQNPGVTYEVVQEPSDGLMAVIVKGRDFVYNKVQVEIFRHADYKPAAGDVVSFEYGGKTFIGIIGTITGNACIWFKRPERSKAYRIGISSRVCLRKIDKVDLMGKNGNEAAKAYFAEPKSYTERQAAWVKENDVKVGSKVKVVRKFGKDDGYGATGWDYRPDKAAMQGGVFEVKSFLGKLVNLWTENKNDWWSFPYFALEPV